MTQTEETGKVWEVWAEGYHVTGCEGIPVPANLVGRVRAATFDDAVRAIIDETTSIRERSYFTKHPDGIWTQWGCQLFDNEKDARRSFG